MQPIMKHIIGDFQTVFILGGSINDNCVFTHEMSNYIKRRTKKNVHYASLLNLDLNKAYDRISWVFVEKVLKKIGLKFGFTSSCNAFLL